MCSVGNSLADTQHTASRESIMRILQAAEDFRKVSIRTNYSNTLLESVIQETPNQVSPKKVQILLISNYYEQSM